jgi:AraC-like DNA-binding protein
MGRVDYHNLGQWHEMARRAGYKRDRLSALLEICPRQLQRVTLRIFGQSPQEWLDEQRLAAAAGLLRKHRSVKYVSFQLNFKQVSHFSRAFKHHYGVSPAAFLIWDDRQRVRPPDVLRR